MVGSDDELGLTQQATADEELGLTQQMQSSAPVDPQPQWLQRIGAAGVWRLDPGSECLVGSSRSQSATALTVNVGPDVLHISSTTRVW